MNKQERIGKRAFVVRIALTVVVMAAASLIAAGCGNKMARIEENQLKLQALVEMNAHQINKAAQHAEQSQQDLQAAIKLIRNSTEELAAQIASFGSEHAKLQETMQANNALTSDKITGIEEKQANLESNIDDLQTGAVAVAADMTALGEYQTKLAETMSENHRALTAKMKAVEDYQGRLKTEIGNVQAAAAQVAADLAEVADAHAKLEQTVREEGGQMNERLSASEQKQLAQQDEIEAVESNVRKAATSIAALEENLAKLQEVAQNDARNLADVIEMIGRSQIDFEGKVQRDIRKLADSISAVEQRQANLAEQAQKMQSALTMLNGLTATVDMLKAGNSATEPAKIAKTKIAESEEPKQQN